MNINTWTQYAQRQPQLAKAAVIREVGKALARLMQQHNKAARRRAHKELLAMCDLAEVVQAHLPTGDAKRLPVVPDVEADEIVRGSQA